MVIWEGKGKRREEKIEKLVVGSLLIAYLKAARVENGQSQKQEGAIVRCQALISRLDWLAEVNGKD